MKKLIVVIAILFSISSSAQETITKNIGSFSMLKVYNGLHVHLIASDVNAVEISGSRAEDVVVKNTNGKLKIFLNIEGTFSPKDVNIIKLFTSEAIETLDANEGSFITSEEKIIQNSIELRAQEGASIKIPLKVEYLTTKAVTGGRLTLRGVAINQEVELNTGGNYDAIDLVCKETTVKAGTGSEAYINTSDYLNARASLGGEIYYTGNPSNVKSKTTLGGKVKAKK